MEAVTDQVDSRFIRGRFRREWIASFGLQPGMNCFVNPVCMNNTLRLVALFSGFVLGGFLSETRGEILAGVTVVDITPPIGGQTVGYGSPQPTDGINHPVTARVLYLESAETAVALVAWDLCVASSPWLHTQMAELGIDRLLLVNTHTHAG